MDIEVYCQNPECGEFWGRAELVNPGYEWEPAIPHTDFRAFYDNMKNCWFCPSCGFGAPAHIIGSETQLWLRDLSQPAPEDSRRKKRRPARKRKRKPNWDKSPEDSLFLKLIKVLLHIAGAALR